MTSYYCSGLPYRPKSIIQPGNWGKVIEGAGAAHQYSWREIAFEMSRELHAPNSASRLESVFSLPTEEDARAYAPTMNVGTVHIYEIRPLDERAPHHRGDLNVFNAFPNAWGFDSWREILAKY